ncbi:MAG: hypothetical protein ND895_23585 [Pyrinomonadaceae bacterium]|nr:hypothetical protein [Pyrinomonadaceae bacterium]
MFSHTSSISPQILTRLMLAAGLLACLVLLAVSFLRPDLPDAGRPASAGAMTAKGQVSIAPSAPAAKLEGEAARNYLERTAEGQSLMKTLTTARFGLERREESPFAGDTGAGYLGLSHDENLNAWFDDEGVTLRPTVREEERAKSWQMRMRLRAYGYGEELHEARKQCAPTVNEDRIEYDRNKDEASARVVEWYVNKSEGIEQGFTLNTKPQRGASVPDSEHLRLIVSVAGDLRASTSHDGQSVELSRDGSGVLSYSKLTALDASGAKLAARMEANAAGDEIALVVDDNRAVYPIVVDPITATLKQELSAVTAVQAEARFGFSVAINNNLAIVGAWREDIGALIDQGAAYIFVRQTNWVFESRQIPALGGQSQCGWSVAVDENFGMVIGCPGFNNSRGSATFLRRNAPNTYGFVIVEPSLPKADEDRFGYSVGISSGSTALGTDIIVGAPMKDYLGNTDAGTITIRQYDQNMNPIQTQEHSTPIAALSNAQFGSSVALYNGRAVAGGNGRTVTTIGSQAYVGGVHVFQSSSPGGPYVAFRQLAGDLQSSLTSFGNGVAIGPSTVVVSDPLLDTSGGADAGAVYVYDLAGVAADSTPLLGQKLTASDGKSGDLFGEHAVAVGDHGDTIVVGAYGNGQGGDPINGIPDDDRGAAYVFTKSNGVWSQQAKISQGNFGGGEAGDHFGIDVDISGNTVIIGARAASAGSTLRAGAAFIYELDCLPPLTGLVVNFTNLGSIESASACPGSPVTMSIAASSGESFQWRKDGVIIPGATSSTHNISNMTANDVGIYDVIVTKACGTVMSRTGTLSLHSLSINPTSQNFSASGSTGIVNVTSTGSCGWTATSNASWINITSGSSGTGNGTVGFSVAANTGAQRTGTLTVAGQTFSVAQDGPVVSATTVQFSQSVYSLSEGAGGATVLVTRTGNLSSAATVEYATTDGTATDRGDYNTTIGRLRFAAGENSKNFIVLLNDDAYAEGTESLNLTLSNPTGGTALGSPFTATLTINDNDASTSTANPLDTTGFFVRQQYVDFFSREADAPGLSFWTNNIDSCGANVGCREVKRIDTSAAFFLSIEFQETGFLVHRLYRASFNRLTRYREFIRDSQEIGRGVVVNSPGWEALLEANKQAFVSEFAARADFQSIYGGMTNAQYVDALNANTGGSLSSAERNALVSGLNAATETRATALRKVAEDADFRARETSPAFVLLQYFGYLRRNPDDPPEPGLNFNGYNFWLGKLNSFGGDYRAAEMVKAFLVSTEYRSRFGQP